MLFRVLMSAFAAFAVAGCNLGLASAVDAVPFDARTATQPFADGVYCGLDEDADNQLIVRSLEEDGGSSCSTWTWDAARRLFVVTGKNGPMVKTGELAVADLGDGLLLLQFPQREAEGEETDKPWSFLLMVGMAEGDAIAIAPLSGQAAHARAASYPGITFSTLPPAPFTTPVLPEDAAPDAELPAPPAPDYYISAGAPEDIRKLVRAITVEGMRDFTANPENYRPPPEHGVFIPVLVGAEAGAPDHAPTPEQLRDIDAIMKRLWALGAP